MTAEEIQASLEALRQEHARMLSIVTQVRCSRRATRAVSV
jgi:hypothetical protein